MTAVTRLVTLVDLHDDIRGARDLSFSARHEAILSDGRRRLLLEGRGWTQGLRGAVPDGADPWASTSAEDIEETARAVVGPDEPAGGGSQEDAVAGHWAFIAGVLRAHGVHVDVPTLAQLPHDVVLSDRLRARLGPPEAGRAR